MENNLPPFYVGQKVVALRTSPVVNGAQIIKGNTYTVKDIFFCKCGDWIVVVKEVKMDCPKPWTMCCKENYHSSNVAGPSYVFAPIEENFQPITLEKVLEQETQFISVN